MQTFFFKAITVMVKYIVERATTLQIRNMNI